MLYGRIKGIKCTLFSTDAVYIIKQVISLMFLFASSLQWDENCISTLSYDMLRDEYSTRQWCGKT